MVAAKHGMPSSPVSSNFSSSSSYSDAPIQFLASSKRNSAPPDRNGSWVSDRRGRNLSKSPLFQSNPVKVKPVSRPKSTPKIARASGSKSGTKSASIMEKIASQSPKLTEAIDSIIGGVKSHLAARLPPVGSPSASTKPPMEPPHLIINLKKDVDQLWGPPIMPAEQFIHQHLLHIADQVNFSKSHWSSSSTLLLYFNDNPTSRLDLACEVDDDLSHIPNSVVKVGAILHYLPDGCETRARFSIPRSLSDSDAASILFHDLSLPVNSLIGPVLRGASIAPKRDIILCHWTKCPQVLASFNAKDESDVSTPFVKINWGFQCLPSPLQPTCPSCNSPHSSKSTCPFGVDFSIPPPPESMPVFERVPSGVVGQLIKPSQDYEQIVLSDDDGIKDTTPASPSPTPSPSPSLSPTHNVSLSATLPVTLPSSPSQEISHPPTPPLNVRGHSSPLRNSRIIMNDQFNLAEEEFPPLNISPKITILKSPVRPSPGTSPLKINNDGGQ